MRLQLLRHATLKVEIGDTTLLVDPMLADAGSTPPIQNGPDDRKNPLVPLPISIRELLTNVQAVLVTHRHRDHWDDAAAKVISRQLPILCQPPDEQNFRESGYSDVRPVNYRISFSGIEISRTEGQHGTGDIGKLMAPVSGFVLRSGNITLYIAGDTIWCDEVRQAIALHRPTHVVVNAGGAKFIQGDPITMTPQDVEQVCLTAHNAQIIVVHMESINHCLITRQDLASHLVSRNLRARVAIPADGEWLELSSIARTANKT